MNWRLRLIFLTLPFMTLTLFHCGGEEGAEAYPRAPDFSLSDLSGRRVSLEDQEGKVVLLDFWATWCPPCLFSIPELIKLQKKYRDQGVIVLGVSLDEPEQISDAELLAFKEKVGINYKILRYSDRVMQEYFRDQLPAIPTMFLIDREGRIRDKFVGLVDPEVIESSLTGILE